LNLSDKFKNLIQSDNGPALLLAPLAGVTDSTYRYLCHREGSSLSYTEMVSAKGLYYKSPGSEELMRIYEREGNVGIQLFGSEPEMIAFAVDYLKDRNNVLFDINMGCPVPKIYNNGEGSALLKNVDLAKAIVSAAVESSVKSSQKPVTVKMRLVSYVPDRKIPPSVNPFADQKLGRDDKFRFEFDDDTDFLPYDIEKTIAFAKAIEEAGASAITVHGRTREQYYSGHAAWDAIKEIKKAVSIPVIGNGDVRSFEDAKKMKTETGCDAVLIGRGSMGNPWIFRKDGQKPDLDEKKETIKLHLKMLQEEKTVRAVLEMRKHFAWYTKGMTGAASLRDRVNKATTCDEVIALVDEL